MHLPVHWPSSAWRPPVFSGYPYNVGEMGRKQQSKELSFYKGIPLASPLLWFWCKASRPLQSWMACIILNTKYAEPRQRCFFGDLVSLSSLRHVSKLQVACKKMQLLNELMDRGGNYVAASLPFLMGLLERGLGKRILLVTHALPQIPPVTSLRNFFRLGLNFQLISSVLREGHPCGWFLKWEVLVYTSPDSKTLILLKGILWGRCSSNEKI